MPPTLREMAVGWIRGAVEAGKTKEEALLLVYNVLDVPSDKRHVISVHEASQPSELIHGWAYTEPPTERNGPERVILRFLRAIVKHHPTRFVVGRTKGEADEEVDVYLQSLDLLRHLRPDADVWVQQGEHGEVPLSTHSTFQVLQSGLDKCDMGIIPSLQPLAHSLKTITDHGDLAEVHLDLEELADKAEAFVKEGLAKH